MSGAASGACVSVVLQPLDVIRTRMQSDATSGVGRTFLQTIRAVASEGNGVQNLWRGSSATVARVGLGAGVHFYTLQVMRNIRARRSQTCKDAPPWREIVVNAVMGGTSRACAVTILCPITLVKTRMEASGAAANTFVYRSVPHALQSIVRTEGYRALWQGLGPALLANVPFSTLHYAFYRHFQSALSEHVDDTLVRNFASGAGASVLATLITQPFDVLRTRAMLHLPMRSTRGKLSHTTVGQCMLLPRLHDRQHGMR